MPSTISVLKGALAAATVWPVVASLYIPPFGYYKWPESKTCKDNGNAVISPKNLQWKKTDDDWGALNNSCSGNDASPNDASPAAALGKRDEFVYQQIQTTDDIYRIAGHLIMAEGKEEFEACWSLLEVSAPMRRGIVSTTRGAGNRD